MSAGSASPQKKLQRRLGNMAGRRTPSFFIVSATEGTENQMLNSDFLTKEAGLSRVFCDGQQTHAPRSQATNMSNAERSKVMSKVCEKRSCSVIPYRYTTASTKCVTFRCATATPFGVPVLPEVNRR